MNTSSLGLEVLQIFSPVFLAVLTFAAGKLALLIRAKVQNEDLKGVLLRLDDAILTTVKNLQHTKVEQLKAASGKIPEAEKQGIKETALATTKVSLGTKGQAKIAKVLGLEAPALTELLSSKIEAAVHDLRRTSPAPSTTGPAAETLIPLRSAA